MPVLIQVIFILIAVVLVFAVAMYVLNAMGLDPRARQIVVGLLGVLVLLVLIWVAWQIFQVGPGGSLNWGHR